MSFSSRLGPKKNKISYGITKNEEMNLPWKHDKFIPENRSRKFSILIENLHPSATIDDIKASFVHLGNIIDAEYKLVLNNSNEHVGSCVLAFDNIQAVHEAIKEFDQKLADGYLLKVSAVKSILGASSNSRSTGKMYSDRQSSGFNGRLGGMVHDAAKKAAISTRGQSVASRLGPANQTVRFNKKSL